MRCYGKEYTYFVETMELFKDFSRLQTDEKSKLIG
jgi:hypothetical protein